MVLKDLTIVEKLCQAKLLAASPQVLSQGFRHMQLF
jgi:hypothetical protein